jgi:hypothetical protein
VLNRIRERDLDAQLFSVLNAHFQRGTEGQLDSSFITLTATNEAAYQKNRACLARINTKAYTYSAAITGLFDPSIYPTEAVLELKRGTQVMLLKNDPEKRWVNGTLGQIRALSEKKISAPCSCTPPHEHPPPLSPEPSVSLAPDRAV